MNKHSLLWLKGVEQYLGEEDELDLTGGFSAEALVAQLGVEETLTPATNICDGEVVLSNSFETSSEDVIADDALLHSDDLTRNDIRQDVTGNYSTRRFPGCE